MLRRGTDPAIGSSTDTNGPSDEPRWHWWLAVGAMLLVTAAVLAGPVPSGNEPVYLLVLRRLADPNFLPGDWTLTSSFSEHFVFNRLAAPLALLDLTLLAWVGRAASWIGIAALAIGLGRRLKVSSLGTAAAVALWIGLDQGMRVGGEIIMGAGLEAKSLAYPLLFGALLLALDRKVPLAMVLAGLAATIHPGVGLWGSGALAAALLWEKSTRFRAIRWLPAMALAALPGILIEYRSLQTSPLSDDSAEFITRIRLPHHIDPVYFGRRGWLVLIAIVGFNLLWGWAKRSDYVQRLLLTIQVILTVPLVLGVGLYVLEQYWFPLTFPFRVLPPLASLLFGLHLAAAFRRWRMAGFPRPHLPAGFFERLVVAAGVVAVLAVVVIRNPVAEFVHDSRLNIGAWNDHEDDEYEEAMRWIASETPLDAQVLAPPYEDDVMWLAERPLFVSWKAMPYDMIDEWRSRLEQVGIDQVENMPEDWDWVYAELPETEIRQIVDRYEIDYIVTSASYDLPIEATFGSWKVYRSAS